MQPYYALTLAISLIAVLGASFVVLPSVIGQSAPNQDQSPNKTPSRVIHWTDREAFADFINSEGKLNENDQLALSKGLTPAHPAKDWPHGMTTFCGLPEYVLTDMYYIALDTFSQAQEHDKQWRKLADEYNDNPSRDLAATVDQFNQQRPKIYSDGIDRMKQELGEEDFAKFSKCIDQIYGGTANFIGPVKVPPIPDSAKPPQE